MLRNRMAGGMILAMVILAVWIRPLWADDTPETKELRERIRALEERVQSGKPTATSKHPWFERVAISGGVLTSLSATSGYADGADALNRVAFEGVSDREEKERLDLSTSVDLFFEFPVGFQGIASMHLSLAKGDGVNPEINDATGVTPFADDTEQDLVDNNKLLEAWYEGTYFGGKLVTTVGILDGTLYIDANEAAHDETQQFMNTAFYASPLHGIPSYTPGLRLTWRPGMQGYATLLFIEGEDRDSAQERLFARSDNHSTLYALEVGTPYGTEERQGDVRFYGWYDSTDYDRFDAKGTKNSRGIGVSFDQKVSDRLTLFARATFGDGEILEFDRFYSIGGALDLGKQTVGLAAGILKSSSEAKTSLSGGGETVDLNEKSLVLFELYDRFQLFDTVSITPDLQYTIHPRGSGDLDRIVVAGVRVNVNF